MYFAKLLKKKSYPYLLPTNENPLYMYYNLVASIWIGVQLYHTPYLSVLEGVYFKLELNKSCDELDSFPGCN